MEGTVTMPIFKVNSVKGGSRVKEGSWDLWSCQAETGEDGKPDLSNLRAVLVQLKQVKRQVFRTPASGGPRRSGGREL